MADLEFDSIEKLPALRMKVVDGTPANNRNRYYTWLSLLLVAVLLVLLFQLLPHLKSYLDLRQWTHTTWVSINILILFVLIGIRFGPSRLPSQSKQIQNSEGEVTDVKTATNQCDKHDYS